jgi:hypothetical protein
VSTVPDGARYRAIEAVNGTANIEYLTTLEEGASGGLIGETTDGRAVVYTDGFPVKIKEVREE